MREIGNRLYTFQLNAGNTDFLAVCRRWIPIALG